jgi:hypothetical protein
LAQETIQVLPSQGVRAGSLSENSHGAIPATLEVSLTAKEKKGTKSMPLMQVLIALIVVGILLWLVNRFIPMQGTIKSILNGVVVIAVVLWLLNIFGLFHSFAHIRIGT